MAPTKPKHKDSEQYTTYKGETILIQAVPQLVISGIKMGTPKPKRPRITMKTKAGDQQRWAKAGDDEYDDWKIDSETWDAEKQELESAVVKVMALRSYEVTKGIPISKASESDLLPIPDETTQLMIDTGLIDRPDNIWKLRELWLNSVVLSQHDDLELTWILQKLGGVPEDMIEQMKASFRNTVLGTTTDGVGTEAGEYQAGNGDIDG